VKQVAKNSNGLAEMLDYIRNRRETQDKSALVVSPIGQNKPPDTISSTTQPSEPIREKNTITTLALKRDGL
jgi:hypothetical protein